MNKTHRRIKEVFTKYGYLIVDAAELNQLKFDLPIFYLKYETTGNMSPGGHEIKLIGCWSDIYEALLEYWNPYNDPNSFEAKQEMLEWMEDFNGI